MVDIHSATTENRRGKKKEEIKKLETTGAKYNVLPVTMGGFNEHTQCKLYNSN